MLGLSYSVLHTEDSCFFTIKDSKGDIDEILVESNDEPIPLIDGMVVLSNFKEIEVCYQLIDDCGNRIDANKWHHFHGVIRIPSLKTPIKLENVKRAIPSDYKELLDGEPARYLFTEGLVKKELINDLSEISIPNEEKKIKCQIMLSQNSIKKFDQHWWFDLKGLIKGDIGYFCLFIAICFSITYFQPIIELHSPMNSKTLLSLLSGLYAFYVLIMYLGIYFTFFGKENRGDSCIKLD